MPFDIAFQVDDVTRTAWAIVCAGFEGAKFDWSAMKFKEEAT